MEAKRISGGAALAVALALAPAASARTGVERFDGGLVVNGKTGQRKVVGSAIAASGVFSGVGRFVERPNRPGDSAKVSRDDLVFAEGTLHIVNTTRKATLKVDRRTCVLTLFAQQTTKVAGGTGRFAGATGRFTGTVSGTGVARRRSGRCDQSRSPLVEIDRVSAAGTLTL